MATYPNSYSLGSVSPIDETGYELVLQQGPRMLDEASQLGKDGESAGEGSQASNEVTQVENHAQGTWDGIVTQSAVSIQLLGQSFTNPFL